MNEWGVVACIRRKTFWKYSSGVVTNSLTEASWHRLKNDLLMDWRERKNIEKLPVDNERRSCPWSRVTQRDNFVPFIWQLVASAVWSDLPFCFVHFVENLRFCVVTQAQCFEQSFVCPFALYYAHCRFQTAKHLPPACTGLGWIRFRLRKHFDFSEV